MTAADLDHLAGLYLDGEASRAQVIALREALRGDPVLRARFAAHVRLHRAQGAVLGRPSRPARHGALAALHVFAARAGRTLAYACVLLMVVVELDVNLPGLETQSWLPLSEVPALSALPPPFAEPEELTSADDSPPEHVPAVEEPGD